MAKVLFIVSSRKKKKREVRIQNLSEFHLVVATLRNSRDFPLFFRKDGVGKGLPFKTTTEIACCCAWIKRSKMESRDRSPDLTDEESVPPAVLIQFFAFGFFAQNMFTEDHLLDKLQKYKLWKKSDLDVTGMRDWWHMSGPEENRRSRYQIIREALKEHEEQKTYFTLKDTIFDVLKTWDRLPDVADWRRLLKIEVMAPIPYPLLERAGAFCNLDF